MFFKHCFMYWVGYSIADSHNEYTEIFGNKTYGEFQIFLLKNPKLQLGNLRFIVC